jgi:hypothetical protein
MGVNISGQGVLSGIASLVAGVVNNFNLLVTSIIGYTNVPGTGGSSYYTTTVGSSGPGFVNIQEYGAISYSTDGINWSIAGSLPQYMGPVTYANNIFVAMTFFGETAYSTDGINWSLGTDLPGFSFNATKIKFANNIFTVVNNDGQTAYSTDGITWSLGTNLNFTGVTVRSIQFGNNVFTSLTQDGKTFYSTDGINWSLGTQISGTFYKPAQFGNNKFTVISESGQTAYSTDGINWSLGTDLPGDFGWSSPIAFGNVIFTTANDSGQTAYSTDGINWSLGNVAGYGVRNATFGNGIFVAVFYGGQTLYSGAGVTWYLGIDLPGDGWNNVPTFGNNMFVVMSSEGQTAYSTDGINWSLGTDLPGDSGWFKAPEFGTISTLVETQISIGGQGSGGAEILAPVDVYTVPELKATNIDQVTIKNNSANTITFDLAVLDSGIELTDLNSLINDQAIPAGARVTITSISNTLTAGQRIIVFPSAVDVVEVKVYGTEFNI